jgi:hypothetical protein
MEDPPLLEEQYAPDTVRQQPSNAIYTYVSKYKVLVTCIFLNKTEAVRARPHLEAFLEKYPSPDALQDADPEAIRTEYFADLGLFRRAYWLVEMASQLLSQPPRPNKLKRKSYKGAGYASEVAYLTRVGDYASDAWRLFCKKPFYASYGTTIEDEWKTLDPQDKDLRRYVERKRREDRTTQEVEDVTIWMAKVKLSRPQRPRPAACGSSTLEWRDERTTLQVEDDAMWMAKVQLPRPRKSRPGMRGSSTLLGSGDHALRIPQRIINDAITNSTASSKRWGKSDTQPVVTAAS